MISYEKTLEETVDDLETHVEALESDVEDLSCQNDSYVHIMDTVFSLVVLHKIELEKVFTTIDINCLDSDSQITNLNQIINLLHEALPEVELEDEDE